MVSAVRHQIAKEVVHSIRHLQKGITVQNAPTIASCISTITANKKAIPPFLQFSLSFKHCHALGLLEETSWPEQIKWARSVVERIQSNTVQAEVCNTSIGFQIDHQTFAETVLCQIANERNQYGLQSDIHHYRLQNNTITHEKRPQNVVIDFSSPNIAKPFHAGHLRSTIIGNFIANINSALGHKVMRINYLGDWGTQYGILGSGFSKYGNEEKLEDDPMQHLFEVYVKSYRDAEKNPEDLSLGKDYFTRMEKGDSEALSLWKKCRELSIKEYRKVYKRLNVHFDEYHGESMYMKKSLDVIERMKKEGMLDFQRDTGIGIVNLCDEEGRSFYASVLKSDGSTMYLTRDIAAAIDRHDKYQFDKLHYVVENGQNLHFKHLVHILKKMGYNWAEKPLDEFHVKFGLIQGMSTRKGKVVFLNDILDEARDRMVTKINSTETSKVTENVEEVADVLGMSAVIIQDLLQKRTRNYKFSWERMLQFDGQTGVYLQYTHARLCSLERNCGVDLDVKPDWAVLTEPQAHRLIQHLASYDEIIKQAYSSLEPSHVVHYCFKLCHFVNAANEVLHVKGNANDIAKARLLLFHCARITLGNAMRLVGLQPLEKM